jgi:hypothetical protein
MTIMDRRARASGAVCWQTHASLTRILAAIGAG